MSLLGGRNKYDVRDGKWKPAWKTHPFRVLGHPMPPEELERLFHEGVRIEKVKEEK